MIYGHQEYTQAQGINNNRNLIAQMTTDLRSAAQALAIQTPIFTSNENHNLLTTAFTTFFGTTKQESTAWEAGQNFFLSKNEEEIQHAMTLLHAVTSGLHLNAEKLTHQTSYLPGLSHLLNASVWSDQDDSVAGEALQNARIDQQKNHS